MSETFLILGISQRDVINNVYWSSCKGPVILVQFSCNLNFLDIFSKNISNFVKIRPVRAELFLADRRTDMTNVTVAFHGFANAPKIRTNERPFSPGSQGSNTALILRSSYAVSDNKKFSLAFRAPIHVTVPQASTNMTSPFMKTEP